MTHHLAKIVSAHLQERIETWCGTRSVEPTREEIMDQIVFEPALATCQRCSEARAEEFKARFGYQPVKR